VLCDSRICAVGRATHVPGQPVSVLNCGHSFHRTCYQQTCPICQPNLQDKIEKLTKSFNEGLLKGGEGNVEEEGDDNGDDDNDVDVQSSTEKHREYYLSNKFRIALVARFRQRIIEQ